MDNVIENVVEVAPVVVPAVVVADETPQAEKVDRRKGKRRVDNADGTRSYGFKADGTPRKKPGRPAKAKPAADVA